MGWEVSTPLGTHDAGLPQARLPETSPPRRSGVASCVPSGAASPSRARTADPGGAARLIADIATTRPYRAYRFCNYCGAPCRGLTCGHHRDLLALDVNTAKGVANLVKESTEGSRQVRPDGAPLRRR